MFGLGGSDSERVFFSGNPDRPNVDWHSETHAPDYLTDPAYIPDTSFAHIGSDGSAVMGYRRMGDSQLIIKQESDHDATLFLRRSGQDSAGRPVFPITQGAAGVGAVSSRAFANIGDEPLFFSSSGVCGISTDGISSEKKLQNRSFFIDRALCAESGLENAAAVEWEGRYVLALNGRCYVLDGRQGRSHRAQSGGDYVYECFLWENVPASALAENGGELYFGTESGAVCKFNTDIPGVDRYNDDGAPITAVWTTKEDDDGDFGRHKNLSQRWLSVFLKPYARSSAKVYLRTEKVPVKPAGETTVDIFDFAELWFDRLPFNTSSQPQVFPVRAKVKRYETLQISVENSAVNEGFGVLGIIKRFTMGGRVK